MYINVLITGVNQDIGLGLLRRYLLVPDHLVVAAVRDPTYPTAKALPGPPGWAKEGIGRQDMVIINAGVAASYPLVREVTKELLAAHFRTNTYSIPALFQAVYPLPEVGEGVLLCRHGKYRRQSEHGLGRAR
ncbi:hypothetical protein RB594_006520 [Gaeumannomyces avenae]